MPSPGESQLPQNVVLNEQAAIDLQSQAIQYVQHDQEQQMWSELCASRAAAGRARALADIRSGRVRLAGLSWMGRGAAAMAGAAVAVVGVELLRAVLPFVAGRSVAARPALGGGSSDDRE